MTPEKIEEILTNPDTIIGLAEALKREQTKRKEFLRCFGEMALSVCCW